MMTFIVFGDFVINATFLDNKRLGKQRVEAMQLIDAIEKGTAWKKHPAAVSWKNHVDGLKYYANCIINEWIKRGFNNTMEFYVLPETVILPWWTQWSPLHHSHRAMLIRKDPFFYKDKFDVDPLFWNFGYIWPNKINETNHTKPLSELADKIPDDLQNPIYCQHLLTTGKRKGHTCNILVKSKKSDQLCTNYCGFHHKKYLN